MNTIEHNKIVGEFIGTLKGVCLWEIPDKLKVKLERQIKDLENSFVNEIKHKTRKGAK